MAFEMVSRETEYFGQGQIIDHCTRPTYSAPMQEAWARLNCTFVQRVAHDPRC
jgi:hypothetical protein